VYSLVNAGAAAQFIVQKLQTHLIINVALS
jgi:hypothetical protein